MDIHGYITPDIHGYRRAHLSPSSPSPPSSSSSCACCRRHGGIAQSSTNAPRSDGRGAAATEDVAVGPRGAVGASNGSLSEGFSACAADAETAAEPPERRREGIPAARADPPLARRLLPALAPSPPPVCLDVRRGLWAARRGPPDAAAAELWTTHVGRSMLTACRWRWCCGAADTVGELERRRRRERSAAWVTGRVGLRMAAESESLLWLLYALASMRLRRSRSVAGSGTAAPRGRRRS
jgi:hypothetical protein